MGRIVWKGYKGGMTLLAFAGLAFPVLLGLVVGALGVLGPPDAAIAPLNRYALYVAFPALIASGLTDAAFAMPSQPGFWLVVPVAMGLTVWPMRWLPAHAGTVALTSLFGNVAYVGLPLCVAVLGPQALGTAALAVSAFAVVSLLIGPVLLVRWSRGYQGPSPLGAVLRQPLLWAPLVGLLVRGMPEGVVTTVNALIKPVGASAAPVALFLLGLYLWAHRRDGSGEPGVVLLHVAGKMVWFPAVVAACVFGARALGWAEDDAARCMLLLSATPSAIATFALAQEFGLGQQRVAQAIVASTVLAAGALPAAVWAVGWAIP